MPSVPRKFIPRLICKFTKMSMYNYSTSSSEISTPRSTSPASMASSRSSTSTNTNNRRSLSTTRRISEMNPLSSINIQALEAQMQANSLDGLRGYSQDHYGVIKQHMKTEYLPKSHAGGYQILREPSWNKGARFLNISNSLTVVLICFCRYLFPSG